jgi:hypothetical protein
LQRTFWKGGRKGLEGGKEGKEGTLEGGKEGRAAGEAQYSVNTKIGYSIFSKNPYGYVEK